MNILIFSNTSTTGQRYGYSVVTEQVKKALQKAGHQVINYGMQSIHPPYKDEDGIINVGIRYDGWGSDILEDLFKMYNVDVLITLMDIWLPNTYYIPQACRNKGVFWICHVTINSYPLTPFIGQQISQADVIVAPSKFCQKTVQDAGFRAEYIPHGVDLSIFKPLGEDVKKEMKKKLKIEDKDFVLLSVMRNKGLQKNYPALFQAWRMVLQNNPELQQKGILLVLADPLEPDGLRIDLVRQQLGMQQWIKLINMRIGKEGLEPTTEDDPEGTLHNANYVFNAETMAKIYNIADIHVTSSYGESFNLPTLESMACGVPQIANSFSTGPELIGEPRTGLLADIQAFSTVPLLTDIAHVSVPSLAEKIILMYKNKEQREKMGKTAEAFAKGYSWDIICDRWVELMKKVEESLLVTDYAKGRLGI